MCELGAISSVVSLGPDRAESRQLPFVGRPIRMVDAGVERTRETTQAVIIDDIPIIPFIGLVMTIPSRVHSTHRG